MKLAAILFIGRVEKNGRYVKDVFRTQWMDSGLVKEDESRDPEYRTFLVAAWCRQMMVHRAADGVYLLYETPAEVKEKVAELSRVNEAAAVAEDSGRA